MSRAPKPSGSRPIVSQYANDPEMAELVELFISELPTRLNAFQSAWRANQFRDLRRMAHQLKGASAGYGFPAIGDAAGALEHRLGEVEQEASLQALKSIGEEFSRLVDLCSRACARG